jgi:alkylated DNA repair protein (DNA oxidative demethylase)
MPPVELAPGLVLHPGYLDRAGQEALAETLRGVARAAPLFTPRMPRTGRPFSVRMTNAGRLGWVSDEAGYRYQSAHPATGAPWPPIPDAALAAWRELSGYDHDPEACLVTVYGAEARMGLHQDRDEEALDAPVVSLSLGRHGPVPLRGRGAPGPDPLRAARLGDALVLGGPARLAFHGVDRTLPGTSPLLTGGGRINLTLRRVTKPA